MAVGLRTTALRLTPPVEVNGPFRDDSHRAVFMMAQAGQGFQRHVAS